MIGDPSKDIGEPGARIDIVQLGGDDQRIDVGGPLATAIGACDQPCLTLMNTYS